MKKNIKQLNFLYIQSNDVYSIYTCMMYEKAMRVYSRARRPPPMTQLEFDGGDGGGERG